MTKTATPTGYFKSLNLRDGVILIGLFDILISIVVICNNMVSLMDKLTDAVDSRRSYFYISAQSETVDVIGIVLYTMIMLSACGLIVGVIKSNPSHLKPWMTFKLLLVVVGVLSQIVYLCVLSVQSEGGTRSRFFKYIFVMELAVVVQLGKAFNCLSFRSKLTVTGFLLVLAIYMLLTVSTYYSLLKNTKDVERRCTETC